MCAVCEGAGLTDGDGVPVKCPGCGVEGVVVEGQMALPGVVRECGYCGEVEGSPFATKMCVFVQRDPDHWEEGAA